MSKPGRQLGQLLQEQQEPFVLETYLLEKGCLQKTSFTSEGGVSCCYGNYSSNKHLKRSPNCDLNMTGGKGVPQCSKFLRAVFDKLVSIARNPKGELCDHDDEVGSMGVSKEVAEEDRFSPASSTTVFNSCAGGDTEDDSASLQVHLDRPYSTAATVVQALKQTELTGEVQRRSKKHGFRFRFRLRLRPVSVSGESADGTRKQQNSPTRKSGFSNRVIDDSVSTASLKILIQSSPAEPIWPNTSLHCFKSKSALPVDRIREAAAHESNGGGRAQKRSIRELLASEELKKLESQKIRAWGKQPRKGTKAGVNHMVKLDFTASAQEWNGLKSESRKLGREVEEVIVEETINEMIIDMIDY